MKKNIITLLFLTITCWGYSQDNSKNYTPQIATHASIPQITPRSPEAANLMKAILYPVDYSTGLPQIEIPIYEIKLKDGTVLPIKLTYHASGFKVAEAKQRVGIGWTLVAEPQISRSVNGQPDEDYYLVHKNHHELFVNYRNLVEAAYGGDADFQPDHFFYRLIKSSGSFFSRSANDNAHSSGFFTIPYDPIKIEGSPFNQFRIKDQQGYEYYFNPQNNVTRLKKNTLQDSFWTYHTVYKAASISTPFNELITFGYNDMEDRCHRTLKEFDISSHKVHIDDQTIYPQQSSGYFSYEHGARIDYGYCKHDDVMKAWNEIRSFGLEHPVYRARVKIIEDFEQSNVHKRTVELLIKNGTYPTSKEPYVILETLLPDTPDATYKGMVEKAASLSNISFPGGTIRFVDKELIPGEYRVLDYIEIRDLHDQILNRVEFTIENAAGGAPRGLLTKVRFVNTAGEKEYEYAFDYHKDPSITSLPTADDYGSDPWGFINNGGRGTYWPITYRGEKLDLFSTADIGINLYRKRDIAYKAFDDNSEFDVDTKFEEQEEDRIFLDRKHLVLSKITYPTGGSATFDYEPNRFSRIERHGSEDQTYFTDILYYYYPGGIRIKKIEYFDRGNNRSGVRTYKYGKKEEGSGLPFIELKPEDFVITEQKTYYCMGISALDQDYITPYEVVSCYIVNYLGKPIINPLCDVGTSILYDEVAEYYQEIQANNVPGNYSKTIYRYDLDGIENMRPIRDMVPDAPNPIYSGSVGYSFDQWKIGHLKSVEKWGFNSANQYGCMSKTAYKYKIENILYVQDFHRFYSPAPVEYGNVFSQSFNQVFQSWRIPLSDNAFGRSIYYKSYGMSQGGHSDKHELPGESITHNYEPMIQGIKVIEEERDSTDGIITVKKYAYKPKFSHTNPVELSISSPSEVAYTEKYTYSGDDNTSVLAKRNMLNSLISKEIWKDNEMTFKLQHNYWFYHAGNPVSDLSNVPALAYPAIRDVQVGKNNNTLETRLKYHNYDLYGNPLFISKDDAINIVFLWSYQGQYPIAEIKNATLSQVEAALSGITIRQLAESLVPDMEKVEMLRKSQTLKDAQITTCTYKPLVGMTSVTDPRGVTTYFAYDAANRLQESYLIENGLRKTIQTNDYHYRE